MKMRALTIFILLITLVLNSCGPFNKLEKSTNWEELYEGANNYYQAGEYNKAIILYDKVLPVIRGSEKSEVADYNYANCHFKTKRYIESAGYFSTFYRTYNRSPLAEEALFMNAYALYLDSPDYNLDQQSSQKAVSAIQQFVTVFPGSASYERAMGMLNELQKRFEEKAYQESTMYYRLKDGLFPGDFLRACMVNFQNFSKDFPESKYNEELAYKLVEVSVSYAKNSTYAKKEDRINEALRFASNFYQRYPSSQFIGKVKEFEAKAREESVSHAKLKEEVAQRMAAQKEAESATNQVEN
jgi:outer membrane protein assembly factor BamD